MGERRKRKDGEREDKREEEKEWNIAFWNVVGLKKNVTRHLVTKI